MKTGLIAAVLLCMLFIFYGGTVQSCTIVIKNHDTPSRESTSYWDGVGYTQTTCEAACGSDSLCFGYSFDSDDGKCAKSAETGAKNANSCPTCSFHSKRCGLDCSVTYTSYGNDKASENPYSTLTKSYPECETSCSSDQTCVGFGYDSSNNQCTLTEINLVEVAAYSCTTCTFSKKVCNGSIGGETTTQNAMGELTTLTSVVRTLNDISTTPDVIPDVIQTTETTTASNSEIETSPSILSSMEDTTANDQRTIFTSPKSTTTKTTFTSPESTTIMTTTKAFTSPESTITTTAFSSPESTTTTAFTSPELTTTTAFTSPKSTTTTTAFTSPESTTTTTAFTSPESTTTTTAFTSPESTITTIIPQPIPTTNQDTTSDIITTTSETTFTYEDTTSDITTMKTENPPWDKYITSEIISTTPKSTDEATSSELSITTIANETKSPTTLSTLTALAYTNDVETTTNPDSISSMSIYFTENNDVNGSSNLCVCRCVYDNITSLEVRIEERKNTLKMSKDDLSSFHRRLNCAYDPRNSSKVVGGVGILVLTLIMSLIIIPDILTTASRLTRKKTAK